MKYAVIKFAGSQYFVTEGENIEVNKIEGKEGDKLEAKEILLLVEDDKVKIGKPLVDKTKVMMKIVKQFKGDKIRIAKFKAKTGYRRVAGFRPQLTLLEVGKITS